jgi:hypothetical protein
MDPLRLALAFLAPFTAMGLSSSDWNGETTGELAYQLDSTDYPGRNGSLLYIPLVITEPAIGLGGGLAMVYLQSAGGSSTAEFKTDPDITGGGVIATENGTRGGALFDIRQWNDGNLTSKAAAVLASVSLDVYGPGGTGGDPVPRRYILDTKGAQLGFSHPVRWKNLNLSVSFGYFEVDAKLDRQESQLPSLPERDTSRLSTLALSMVHDTRDNQFSPQSGSYLKTSLTLSDERFGASQDYQKLQQTIIHYFPFGDRFVLGVNLDGQAIFGDFPFFLKPFVGLRGVPAMRYQGEYVLSGEVELQIVITEKFRLVGFAGAGGTWDTFGEFSVDQSVVSGGVGFRYRVSRKFGVDLGIDVATSGEDSAAYLQVGCAWLRL